MPFPASRVPNTLSKIFHKTIQKVILKSVIKALSEPFVREAWVVGKIMYQALTSTIQASTTAEKSSGDSDNKATEELSVVIDDLLNQLGTKFSTISEELLGKSELRFFFLPFDYSTPTCPADRLVLNSGRDVTEIRQPRSSHPSG